MMADFIIAADSAKFGQHEIKLGVTPGMGGSQRLTRAIGKAKAMEMCLTGRMMGAEEAERAGLVARIVPAADLLAEALKTAEAIAAQAPLAAIAAKEMVNAAFETGLAQGIVFERRLFHGLFGTEDRRKHGALGRKRRARGRVNPPRVSRPIQSRIHRASSTWAECMGRENRGGRAKGPRLRLAADASPRELRGCPRPRPPQL